MLDVKNPLKGSLLERNIQRAIYCIENDDKDMAVWFKLQNGVTPQEYIDKWSKSWIRLPKRARNFLLNWKH